MGQIRLPCRQLNFTGKRLTLGRLLLRTSGRRNSMLRPLSFAVALIAAAVRLSAADDPKGVDFFEKHIRPVLVANCYQCHSASSKEIEGGLRLDTREGL